MYKIGFGGSCHWCTEAVFKSLQGVSRVEQGWISSGAENNEPSEAVIVTFDPGAISLEILIAVHLHTHSCTSAHDKRSKYRSAVYTFNEEQTGAAKKTLESLRCDFDKPIITKVLPFEAFKLNETRYLDYYYNDPSKPFCQNIVNPKLRELLTSFGSYIASERKAHFTSL